jgi:hypothetical protein
LLAHTSWLLCEAQAFPRLQMTLAQLEESLLSTWEARKRLRAAQAQQQQLLEVLNKVWTGTLPYTRHVP